MRELVTIVYSVWLYINMVHTLNRECMVLLLFRIHLTWLNLWLLWRESFFLYFCIYIPIYFFTQLGSFLGMLNGIQERNRQINKNIYGKESSSAFFLLYGKKSFKGEGLLALAIFISCFMICRNIKMCILKLPSCSPKSCRAPAGYERGTNSSKKYFAAMPVNTLH